MCVTQVRDIQYCLFCHVVVEKMYDNFRRYDAKTIDYCDVKHRYVGRESILNKGDHPLCDLIADYLGID